MSYRAYRLLNRALWVPIAVAVLCLTSLASALAVLIILIRLESVTLAVCRFTTDCLLCALIRSQAQADIPKLLWLITTMIADLLITVRTTERV
jgi:hypothetical protein